LDFKGVAETRAQLLKAGLKSDKRTTCDEVVVVATDSFDKIQAALRKYKRIRQIHLITHGAPNFLALGTGLSLPDHNISANGGLVKWPHDWAFSSSFPFIELQYLPVQTRSVREFDRSNIVRGGLLDVRGCHTDKMAKALGLHLFGTPGSGTSDYAWVRDINGRKYILTWWEYEVIKKTGFDKFM
jgi:hypothetical protein